MNRVGGTIAAKGKMSGKVKSAETKPLPEYEGEYVIDPKFEDITLETKKKSLYDDMTVKAITTLEVDNEQGGTTFIIGI